MVINNVYQLKELYEKGEQFEFLLFWGHTTAKDGSINASCFSQWWPCEFTVDQVTYSSAEQYMMAGKALLFKDQQMFDQIIKTHDPKTVKALGRKVKNFEEHIWKENCFNIVKKGNIAKFSQNPELGKFLLSTKDKILVEASPFDRIWGIGMGKENKFAEVPVKWYGLNLLGFVLMEVRETISE